MIYYVYMLKSKGINSVTYVGYTNNIKKRLNLHNTGKGAKFTRGRKWVLVYKEKYESRAKGNDGNWFFVDYESRADKKIYWESNKNRADILVYETSNKHRTKGSF